VPSCRRYLGTDARSVCSSANFHHSDEAKLLLEPLSGRMLRMQRFLAEDAYAGRSEEWVREHASWELDIV
jgi:hypothetical protein